MAKAKITAGRIRDLALPPGKSQAFLRDTDAPGLAVRATVGSKSFIFQAQLLDGRTIRTTIGDVRAWDIDKAREEARRLQLLVDQGADPRQEKAARLAAQEAEKIRAEAERTAAAERQKYTLRALCDAYVDHLTTRGRRRGAASARSAFKRHVIEAKPTIAALPASEITPHHVAEIVRRVIEAGKDATAATVRSYLSAAFNAARRAPFDAKLPAALIAFNVTTNPVEPIATIPGNARNRTLSADELQTYIKALGDDPVDMALRVALFSGGQRMAQLLRATAADYDPTTRTLRLFDPKGRRTSAREHLLPLGPQCAALVAPLAEKARTTPSGLLFSSYGTRPMAETTPGKRVVEIVRDEKMAPFNLLDVRRTAETMLAGMGISRDTRAQLLSHGLGGVQDQHYDRHGYADEKRAALIAWERRLDEIEKGIKPAGNVRPLRRKSKTAA